jgi:hypothetical protein
MTSPPLTRWRVWRWRVRQRRQLINTREQARLLERQSCDMTSCPWWARRLERRIRLRATVTWPSWPRASWPWASTAASIRMQIQTSMETVQWRPIPAKILFSDIYSDELALTLYCSFFNLILNLDLILCFWKLKRRRELLSKFYWH